VRYQIPVTQIKDQIPVTQPKGVEVSHHVLVKTAVVGKNVTGKEALPTLYIFLINITRRVYLAMSVCPFLRELVYLRLSG